MKPEKSPSASAQLTEAGGTSKRHQLPDEITDIELNSKVVTTELSVDAIKLDSDLQCRTAVYHETVKQYSDRLKEGDQFPPLVVFKINDEYLLVDGWHRYEAATNSGYTKLSVQVHQGTREDALRYALKANGSHGLPLTNEDKRRSVELALKMFPGESSRVIADICKVSHVFVGKIRPQLETVTSSATRVGRDGKNRKLPVNRRSKSPPQPAPSSPEPPGATRSIQAKKESDEFQGTLTASASPAEPSVRDYSFWDEWCALEEYLKAMIKKMPERRYRDNLVCHFFAFMKSQD